MASIRCCYDKFHFVKLNNTYIAAWFSFENQAAFSIFGGDEKHDCKNKAQT